MLTVYLSVLESFWIKTTNKTKMVHSHTRCAGLGWDWLPW